MPANAVDSRALAHLKRRFNKTFTFKALVDTPDGQGGFTRVWQDFVTVPGALQELSVEERLARGVTTATGNYQAFVEYRSDLTPAMRIYLGTRIFEIAGLTDLGEQNLMLRIDVKEHFKT